MGFESDDLGGCERVAGIDEHTEAGEGELALGGGDESGGGEGNIDAAGAEFVCQGTGVVAGADQDGDVTRSDGAKRAGGVGLGNGGFVNDPLAGVEECLNGIGGGGVAVFVFEAFR